MRIEQQDPINPIFNKEAEAKAAIEKSFDNPAYSKERAENIKSSLVAIQDEVEKIYKIVKENTRLTAADLEGDKKKIDESIDLILSNVNNWETSKDPFTIVKNIKNNLLIIQNALSVLAMSKAQLEISEIVNSYNIIFNKIINIDSPDTIEPEQSIAA